MNSTVKPSFKVVFAEKSTCTFHKQCTGSTKKIRSMNNARDLFKKMHLLGNTQNALPKLTHN